jgi:microcystin-dependent protein
LLIAAAFNVTGCFNFTRTTRTDLVRRSHGESDMEVFLGTIQTFAFPFNPRGWQQCNGQVLSIAQNSALFSLIGTTYGGNGQTTFALPNLQGRAPLSQGNGPGLTPRVIGEVAGSEAQTLLVSNMPQHTHMLNASSTAASTEKPGGNFMAAANDPASLNPINVYGPAADTTMNPGSIGLAGGSQPFSIMPPFLVINFCIAMEGIFPSRN